MNSLTDCVTLANGVKMPCVGFGTGQAPDGDVCVQACLCALEAGYRHIDTAQGYRNEKSVGRAVEQSGLDRRELFITSKLVNTERGYDKTMAAFEGTMEKLGLEYLDLFLIHWPNPVYYRDHWQQSNAETWRAMEELYRAGRIRAIGVSNFRSHHLSELMKTATVAPMVNQIRLCPGNTQDALVDDCRKRGMIVQAYSPLGEGGVFKAPEMQALAEKTHRSIAQLCIRWSIQRGYVPLPKSVTPSRIVDNTRVFDFELSPEEMKQISEVEGVMAPLDDPDTAPY